MRIKANATFKKDKNEQTPIHVDHILKNNEKFKTGVFYCNTNNGSTLFQNGKRIYSKENRIVIFDGHQKEIHLSGPSTLVKSFESSPLPRALPHHKNHSQQCPSLHL